MSTNGISVGVGAYTAIAIQENLVSIMLHHMNKNTSVNLKFPI